MKDSTVERVYGYTGASGLIQGLAAGYFVWDLFVSTRYVKIFGIGIWAHAVTALLVFSFGFVCDSSVSCCVKLNTNVELLEAFLQLLRSCFHPIRAFFPFFEYSLVL